MTERGRTALSRQEMKLTIGPSELVWRDGALEIALDEVGAPIPRRVRGNIRVVPQIMPRRVYDLDDAGRHRWHPIAPRARIEVSLDRPALSWTGSAYIDSNQGDEPLESGFRRWTWSRAHTDDGCIVLYDAEQRSGGWRSMALDVGADGAITAFEPPPIRNLPRTGWRIERFSRANSGCACAVEETLEDTPFYARSLLRTTLRGEPVRAFHESLSLDRFASPIVRAMLPFRMPRRRG